MTSSATSFRELRWDRTVQRSVVHRAALSEVFLTDHDERDGRVLVAAQLPPSHAFYTDHVAPDRRVDPLLLLECARQAETLIVHEHFDAAHDTKFVLHRWALRVMDPPTVGRRPARAVVDVVPEEIRAPDGRVRAASYEMVIRVDGRDAATVSMEVSYVPSSRYPAVRRRRDGPVPTSDTFRRASAGRGVAPAEVGRRDPANVVLSNVVRRVNGLCAAVEPALDHPSLFDHPQDHLPGMTLIEAARQMALVVAAREAVPVRDPVLSGLSARFLRYCELDRPAEIVAARPTVVGDGCEVDMTVRQAGSDITTVTMCLANGGGPS